MLNDLRMRVQIIGRVGTKSVGQHQSYKNGSGVAFIHSACTVSYLGVPYRILRGSDLTDDLI